MKKFFILVSLLIVVLLIYLFLASEKKESSVSPKDNINYKKSVDDRKPVIKATTEGTPNSESSTDLTSKTTAEGDTSPNIEAAKEKVSAVVAKIVEHNKKCQAQIDQIIPDKLLLDEENIIAKRPKELVKIFKQINQLDLISDGEGELNNLVKNEMPPNMDVQWLYQQMEKAGDGCHSYKQIDLLMRTLAGPIKEKWSAEDKKAVTLSILNYFETQLEKPNLGLADLVKVSLLGELADQGLIDQEYKNEIVKISFEYMDTLNPGKMKFEDFQKSMDNNAKNGDEGAEEDIDMGDIESEASDDSQNKQDELKNLQKKVNEFNNHRERLKAFVTRAKGATLVQ